MGFGVDVRLIFGGATPLVAGDAAFQHLCSIFAVDADILSNYQAISGKTIDWREVAGWRRKHSENLCQMYIADDLF